MELVRITIDIRPITRSLVVSDQVVGRAELWEQN